MSPFLSFKFHCINSYTKYELTWVHQGVVECSPTKSREVMRQNLARPNILLLMSSV